MKLTLLINYSVFLLFFNACACGAVDRKPSIAVAVSKSGLQFFSSIGHKIIDHELPKIVIPEISLPIDGGPGEGTVTIKKLTIKKLESPLFQFYLSPPEAINWKSDGGAIKVGEDDKYSIVYPLFKLDGHWKADYTWLIPFHLHGWVEVLTTGIRSNLTLSAFGKDGHPQLQVNGCAVDILSLQLSLGGGVIQWIINLFKSDLSYAVKTAIHEQLCQTLRTIILDQANAALQTLPKHVDISSTVYLDYELEQKPVLVTETHVLGQSYVDVVLGNQTCQLETRPLQIGKINDTFMANIFITETVPNCLLDSAHRSNYFNFVLTKDVYSKLDVFLATSCHWYEICIGKFFPKLREEYPNKHIQMKFHSSKAPSISLLAQVGANVESDFFVDWQIQSEGSSNVNETLARVGMKVMAKVEPMIFAQRLCGSINSTQVEFSEIFSNIGPISESFLKVLDLILTPIIRVAGDTTLRIGIPIPIIENVSITNQTELSVGDGLVRCNADLIYVNPPPSK